MRDHRPLATLPSALPRRRAARTKTTALRVRLPRQPPRDDVSDRHAAANSLRPSLHHPSIELETSTRLHAIPLRQRGGDFQPRRSSGSWPKELFEAANKRLDCDTPREAISDEAKDLAAAPTNSMRRRKSPNQSPPTDRAGTPSHGIREPCWAYTENPHLAHPKTYLSRDNSVFPAQYPAI